MKALIYHGPNNVSVNEVEDAKIQHPDDILVKGTASNMCYSDLHMDEGHTDYEQGCAFGHENVGEIVEVGAGVAKLSVGERVVLPSKT